MAYTGGSPLGAVVRNGQLWVAQQVTTIQVNTPIWFGWLHTTTSFSYTLGRPTFTVSPSVKKNAATIRTGMPISNVATSYTTPMPVVPRLYRPHGWTRSHIFCSKRSDSTMYSLMKRKRRAIDDWRK